MFGIHINAHTATPYDLLGKYNGNIITSWPPDQFYYCFICRSSIYLHPN